jgi:hypothetical protein
MEIEKIIDEEGNMAGQEADDPVVLSGRETSDNFPQRT